MALQGLLSAVATPFTFNGVEIDEAKLRALVERTVSGGVHGIVTCGSTGEFTSMSPSERQSVTEVVLDQVDGRVPVLAHIGAMTAKESIELGKHAERSGAEGVMIVSPFYEPLGLDETLNFFRVVASSLTIPTMIYNLPMATGVNLLPSQVSALAREVEQIQYVKDTSMDMSQAAELIHEHGDVVRTFVGMDTLYLVSLLAGGAGAVNGAANIIAPELVAIYDAVQARDLELSRKLWDGVYPIMKFLASGSYVAGVKGMLDVADFSIGDPRPPLQSLSTERRTQAANALGRLAAASSPRAPMKDSV